MSSKTMKVVIGVLVAALVIVGGLAAFKNMGSPAGNTTDLAEQRAEALASGDAVVDTTAAAPGPSVGE